MELLNRLESTWIILSSSASTKIGLLLLWFLRDEEFHVAIAAISHYDRGSIREDNNSITHIILAETLSANQDEEVWLELIFYRDRKHRDEVDAMMEKDENMGRLFKQSLNLITPGTSFIMGEFSRLTI